MIGEEAFFYEALEVWGRNKLKNNVLRLLIDKVTHNCKHGKQWTGFRAREVALHHLIEGITTDAHPS